MSSNLFCFVLSVILSLVSLSLKAQKTTSMYADLLVEDNCFEKKNYESTTAIPGMVQSTKTADVDSFGFEAADTTSQKKDSSQVKEEKTEDEESVTDQPRTMVRIAKSKSAQSRVQGFHGSIHSFSFFASAFRIGNAGKHFTLMYALKIIEDLGVNLFVSIDIMSSKDRYTWYQNDVSADQNGNRILRPQKTVEERSENYLGAFYGVGYTRDLKKNMWLSGKLGVGTVSSFSKATIMGEVCFSYFFLSSFGLQSHFKLLSLGEGEGHYNAQDRSPYHNSDTYPYMYYSDPNQRLEKDILGGVVGIFGFSFVITL